MKDLVSMFELEITEVFFLESGRSVAFALKERPENGDVASGYYYLHIDESKVVGPLWIAGEDHFSAFSASRPPGVSTSAWDLLLPLKDVFGPGRWKLLYGEPISDLKIHEINANVSGNVVIFSMVRAGGINILPGTYSLVTEDGSILAEFRVSGEERLRHQPANVVSVMVKDPLAVQAVRASKPSYKPGQWTLIKQ